jgi:hypothetical protein
MPVHVIVAGNPGKLINFPFPFQQQPIGTCENKSVKGLLALWQLFSSNADCFGFGDAHLKWREPGAKFLLNQLYKLW